MNRETLQLVIAQRLATKYRNGLMSDAMLNAVTKDVNEWLLELDPQTKLRIDVRFDHTIGFARLCWAHLH